MSASNILNESTAKFSNKFGQGHQQVTSLMSAIKVLNIYTQSLNKNLGIASGQP